MAKVAGPLNSERATGKFGGALVYDTWRGVNIVRSLVSPAYKSTPARALRRTALQALQNLWRQLDDVDRAAWRTWGEHRNQSGHNAFVSCNAILHMLRRGLISTPPTIPPPRPVRGLYAWYVTTPVPAVRLFWTLDGVPLTYLLFFRCVHRGNHTTPDPSEYSYYGTISSALAGVTYNFPPYGTVHWRVKRAQINNGQVSTYVHTQVDCVS